MACYVFCSTSPVRMIQSIKLPITQHAQQLFKHPRLALPTIVKHRFNVNASLKDDSIQLKGQRQEEAKRFLERVFVEQKVDVKQYPLPSIMRKFAADHLWTHFQVRLEDGMLTGNFQKNLGGSINYLKTMHHWSRLQHWDVLRDTKHMVLPFYPVVDPTSVDECKDLEKIFTMPCMPKGIVGCRLFPMNISSPLVVGSMCTRQYVYNEPTPNKVYLKESLEKHLLFNMGKYTWKVEFGYCIHLKEDPEGRNYFEAEETMGSVEELRNLSQMTIFQPLETIADYSLDSKKVKGFLYLSSSPKDLRITIYDAPPNAIQYDLMEFLASADILQ